MTKSDYTKIPNSILAALCRAPLRQYEWRLMMLAIRQTFGWNRFVWHTSVSQVARLLDLERRNVQRTITHLQACGFIKTRPEKQGIGIYMQKPEKWKTRSVVLVDNPVAKPVNIPVEGASDETQGGASNETQVGASNETHPNEK